MKKLPTLFRREFQDHHVIRILPELSRPELSWVLAGGGRRHGEDRRRVLRVYRRSVL